MSLSGDGDVRSLEEAIARCPEGGTIRLGEGTFKLEHPLEITTSLSLLGAGMDRTRVVCNREGFVVKFSGEGRFLAKGIMFQHSGETKANVVEVISGEATFEWCRFQGAVRKDNSGGTGLWFHSVALGKVRKCQTVCNAQYGVAVTHLAKVDLEDNLCQDNRECGIMYTNAASGAVRNNSCRKNGSYGIGVGGEARPILEGNVCEENSESGIAYKATAAGNARNNMCRKNTYHGISLHGKAAPTVEGNTCERNKGCGITYFDSAGGKALKNLCHSNGEYQIRVTEGAKPSLVDNEVYSGISAFMATLGLKRTSGEHEARTLVNSTTEPGCATIIAVGLAFAMFTVCRVILQRLLQ